MENNAIRTACISLDPAFRGLLKKALAASGQGLSADLEISVPFKQIGEDRLREMRALDPQLIVLDLEEDPAIGIRLAEFLVELNPGRRILAVGPALSPDLLLAAMRAGVSEYLTKPVPYDTLAASVGGLARKLRWAPGGSSQHAGQVLAFFSAKGGSGSTTIAANLAIQLHLITGKKTLLADLDIELGEIAVSLGVEARFNFVDMVRNFHRMDEGLLASYIEQHESGVHVLSAPYHPERSEMVTGEQIAQILRLLRQNYDYVAVDTSKSFSPATLATFEQADIVFLVTNADLPSLRNIKRCLPVLEKQLGSADQRLRLIVNRHQADNVITIADVERTLGMRVYWTISNDYDAVMQSISTGKPIILNGKSQYARDLKALAAKIAGLVPEETGDPTLFARGVALVNRVWSQFNYESDGVAE
jgi:pilus assembly protein CpaE